MRSLPTSAGSPVTSSPLFVLPLVRAFVRCLVHVALPLTVGAALYIGGRGESFLGYVWGDRIDLGGGRTLSDGVRSLGETISFEGLPDWTRFSLPDALWVYALTFAVVALWGGSSGRERWGWYLVVLTLGVGAELGQAVEVVPGTFDPVDLMLCLLATLVAYAVARSEWRTETNRPGEGHLEELRGA